MIATGTGETERTRPVSNAEINNELKVLSRMFSLAVEAGKLVYIPKVPMLAENNARTGFFEPEQFDAVCAASAGVPAAARHVHVSDRLALERSADLEWRQIDFAAPVKSDSIRARRRTTRAACSRSPCELTGAARRRSTRSRTKLQKAGMHRAVGVLGDAGQARLADGPSGDAATDARSGTSERRWHRGVSRRRLPGTDPARLPAHGGAEPRARRHSRARGDADDGAQDAVGVRALQHRVARRPARCRAQARRSVMGTLLGTPARKRPLAARSDSSQVVEVIGAGDGDRTRDIELGKLAFYR